MKMWLIVFLAHTHLSNNFAKNFPLKLVRKCEEWNQFFARGLRQRDWPTKRPYQNWFLIWRRVPRKILRPFQRKREEVPGSKTRFHRERECNATLFDRKPSVPNRREKSVGVSHYVLCLALFFFSWCVVSLTFWKTSFIFC